MIPPGSRNRGAVAPYLPDAGCDANYISQSISRTAQNVSLT